MVQARAAIIVIIVVIIIIIIVRSDRRQTISTLLVRRTKSRCNLALVANSDSLCSRTPAAKERPEKSQTEARKKGKDPPTRTTEGLRANQKRDKKKNISRQPPRKA